MLLVENLVMMEKLPCCYDKKQHNFANLVNNSIRLSTLDLAAYNVGAPSA